MISTARLLTFTVTLLCLPVFPFSGAVAQEIVEPQSLESDMADELTHPSMPDVSRNDVEGLVCNNSCTNDPESSDAFTTYLNDLRLAKKSGIREAASDAFTMYFNDLANDPERKAALPIQQKLERRAETGNVSIEQFEAAWKSKLAVAGLSASEVLMAQFEELGVSLAADPEAIQRLTRPVTLSLSDCSRLKAIEEICKTVGVYPDYSGLWHDHQGFPPGSTVRLIFRPNQSRSQIIPVSRQHVVQLRVGPRPLPIEFVGPMAVEICSLKEFVPFATGNLEVRVLVAGLPDSVVACQEMNPGAGQIEAEFDSIKDQHGNVLRYDNGSSQPWFDLPGVQSQTHCMDVCNLLRRAETLHVSGRVRISVPVRVETLTLDKFTKGTVAEAGGRRLEVCALNANEDESYNFQFTLTCQSDDVIQVPDQIAAFDESGKALQEIGPCCYDNQLRERQGKLTFDGKPARLVLKIVAESEVLDYPFELSAQLRSSVDQPEQQTELKFSRDAPVSIDVLDVIRSEPFSSVKVRFTNRSNKDVGRVGYEMHYIDNSGKKLESFPGGFSGFDATNDSPAVGIAKATSTVSEQTAFFITANAVRVEISLVEVRFMDGSSWTPPAAPSRRPRWSTPTVQPVP